MSEAYINVIPMMRGRDAQGAGRHGASRAGGSRLHNGCDFVSNCDGVKLIPGDSVLAFMPGKVTKLGYPYAHDFSFRYVQITDANNYNLRYFYVFPQVEEGEEVGAGTVLGSLQELPYPGIEQHFHFEVTRNGLHIDPIKFLCGDV